MKMRIAAVAAAAVLVSASAVSVAAQGIPLVPKRPTFGIMGGVNLAKISGDDVGSADNRTGFLGGVFLTVHLTNTFAIQPEAIYSQRGASDNSEPGVNVTFKLDYIDVPVLLRFDVPVAGPIRPFLLAGPAFGLQTSCAVGVKGDGASMSVDCDRLGEAAEVQFEKKTFDLSGVVGAGLDFRVGGRTLMLGARYQHGFSDVMEDVSVRNRTWSVVAGLGF